MSRAFWEVDSYAALTTPVRNALLNRFGYVPPVGHTHAAVIKFGEDVPGGGTMLIGEFAVSYIASEWTTVAMEADIATQVRTRYETHRNAQALTTIAGRRHWL